MNTHRLKAHMGKTYRYWDCESEQEAREIMTRVSARGIELTTKGGSVNIIPPWRITKFQISPIRQRQRETVIVPARIELPTA